MFQIVSIFQTIKMTISNRYVKLKFKVLYKQIAFVIIIIYHDFLPTPRRGSHVKSGKTHPQSSRYTP